MSTASSCLLPPSRTRPDDPARRPGTMTLEGEGKDPFALAAGDAFVIPPGLRTRNSAASGDLELLEVSLPGVFSTEQL